MAAPSGDFDPMNEDLYELFGLTMEAKADDINKAYKPLALKWHPDRNEDKELANTMFNKIKIAKEFLLDATKRGQYDAKMRARYERKRKVEAMDAEKREQRNALERREREANERASKRPKVDENVKASLQDQTAKYRERFLNNNKPTPPPREPSPVPHTAGSATFHDNFTRAAPASAPAPASDAAVNHSFVISWGEAEGEAPRFTDASMVEFLEQWGDVHVAHIIRKNPRKIKCIVELTRAADAVNAVADLAHDTTGLKVKWVDDANAPTAGPSSGAASQTARAPAAPAAAAFPSFGLAPGGAGGGPAAPPVAGTRDYETLTIMRMRQAEERRRMEEQIRAEDEAEERAARRT